MTKSEGKMEKNGQSLSSLPSFGGWNTNNSSALKYILMGKIKVI
jgi:hypothetical protein